MPARRAPLARTSADSSAMAARPGAKRSSDAAGLENDREATRPRTDAYESNRSSQTVDLTQDDDDDDERGDELMYMTQADARNSDSFEQYGTAFTKVVGIRYYQGYAQMGEAVILRREPQNQYDHNAIQVLNVQGQQIGHIPRQLASKLASYVDSEDLMIEGTLAGPRGQFDIDMAMRIFGPSDPHQKEALRARMNRDRLSTDDLKRKDKEAQAKRKEELKKAAAARKADKNKSNMQWMNGSQQPGDGAKAPEQTIEDIAGESQVINPREMGKIAERFGAQEDELAKMPMAEQPARMATKMLPYQKQGLAWLLEKENPTLAEQDSENDVQLWKRKDKKFMNIATNYQQKEEPKLARGGILADDMGLGKTVEIISLIVEDKVRNGDNVGPTLIVAPVSVMSNWSGQIARHVDAGSPLHVYTYHGTGRKTMQQKDFNQYDVIITTYGTLSIEYVPKGSKNPPKFPRKTGLYACNWRRVVLDEGHNIRNPNTKNALAACALTSHAKWALTGTPIVNSLKDLYSLIRFIGLTGGLERLEIFNTILMRPMKEGRSDAHLLLQALMGTFCLRRRKDMSFIDLKLPELTEYVHRIKFSEHEQKKYDALQDEAKGVLRTYQDASNRGQGGKAQSTYRHLLEILLRLRQVCNHWKMCEERITNLMSMLEEQKTVDLTPENRRALQDLLQLSIESREDCPICLDTLHNPVITNCGHSFGRECITRVIETQHKCPMCRGELVDENVLVEPAVEYGDDASDPDLPQIDADSDASSKTAALMSILAAVHKNPESKVVVFSQWCRFLDIIQPQLEASGYGVARIDGSMPAAKRDAALQALDSDPKTTIMLASLGVCAVGLNLVAANTVVLCDSWWAPAIEDQAVDRVHRLGQKRETTVWRLVMEGSVEERTLEVQKEKRELMALALREGPEARKRREGGRGRTLRDIQRLLD